MTSTDIIVPPLGESVSEAEVGEWLKQPGDAVSLDEIVVVLETDKVALEVPAQSSGTMGEIIAEAGAAVQPGAVIGTIVAEKVSGDSQEKPAPVPVEPEAEPEKEPEPELPKATPLASRIMEQNDIDASDVQGTGPKGKITAADVRQPETAYTSDESAESAKTFGSGLVAEAARAADIALANKRVRQAAEEVAAAVAEARRTQA